MRIDPEFRALIPALRPEELEILEANLLADGCRDPLVVWDEEDILLDGHNRFEICARHRLPYEIIEINLPNRDAAADWIDANQLGRRNLTPDQMSLLRGRRYNRAKRPVGVRGPEKLAQNEPTSTAERLAVEHGVSPATIKRDGQFAEAVEEVRSTQPEIVARGEKEILAAAKAIRSERTETRRQERTERLAEIAQGDTPLLAAAGPERFPILYADPPWRYEHCEDETRAIENQYPTMSLDAICALPVGDKATPDAVLFLWVTSPKLVEAMSVIDAWGFTYRTCMVWVKDKIGMGYYARQRHELLLIATRGKPPTPPPDARPDSVIEAPRGEHSAKPEEVYALIERMYPTLPRMEMFARRQREGWYRWGNQA